MQKTILVIIGVVVVIAGGWYLISSGVFTNNESVDMEDPVAVVNGETISRGDFEEFKSLVVAQEGVDMTSSEIVDELISQALLRQAVSAEGIVASQEDVDARFGASVAQFGGEEAFKSALAAEGLSEEEFRAQISSELATQAYLEQELDISSITVTDEEIETLYTEALAQDESIPPLEDIRPQVEQAIIQQKQQSLLVEFIDQLRASADIEILL